MFEGENSRTSVPYYKRAIPQVWHMSNGISEQRIKVIWNSYSPEFSGFKRVRLKPDIVTYGRDNPETKFVLIIGTKTMSRLGIILDFKNEMVTLDEQTLPMLDIKSL